MSREGYEVPKTLAARTDLSAAAKLVWAAIVDRLGENGCAWPGLRRIGRDTGLSTRTVQRAVESLAAAGMLAKHRSPEGSDPLTGPRAERTNRYTIPELNVDKMATLSKAERGQNGHVQQPSTWTKCPPRRGQNGHVNVAKMATELNQATIPIEQQHVAAALVALGVDSVVAAELVRQHSPERVGEVAGWARQMQAAGKLNGTAAAWAVAALRGGYARPTPAIAALEREQAAATALKAERDARARRRAVEAAERAAQDQAEAAALERFAALQPEEQVAVLRAAGERIPRLRGPAPEPPADWRDRASWRVAVTGELQPREGAA